MPRQLDRQRRFCVDDAIAKFTLGAQMSGGKELRRVPDEGTEEVDGVCRQVEDNGVIGPLEGE